MTRRKSPRERERERDRSSSPTVITFARHGGDGADPGTRIYSVKCEKVDVERRKWNVVLFVNAPFACEYIR